LLNQFTRWHVVLGRSCHEVKSMDGFFFRAKTAELWTKTRPSSRGVATTSTTTQHSSVFHK
jgi:hypothetical protein